MSSDSTERKGPAPMFCPRCRKEVPYIEVRPRAEGSAAAPARANGCDQSSPPALGPVVGHLHSNGDFCVEQMPHELLHHWPVPLYAALAQPVSPAPTAESALQAMTEDAEAMGLYDAPAVHECRWPECSCARKVCGGPVSPAPEPLTDDEYPFSESDKRALIDAASQPVAAPAEPDGLLGHSTERSGKRPEAADGD
jgi:hypothetical protein